MGERVKVENEILKKARELDAMERSVTTAEADVLERVLEAFADQKAPKIKDCEKVKAMYDKYLAPHEDEELDTTGRLGEDDVADAEDDLEIIE